MSMVWPILKAFIVGGIICMACQLLIDFTKLTPARILTGLVVAGVILGGIGLYPKLVDFAGAGASVPLLGFGNALAQGVKEAVRNDGLIGVFTGGFTAAAGGTAAALFFSMLVALIFKPKAKEE